MHYFKKGSDFVKYATGVKSRRMEYENEFFVTPTYNLFVQDKKKIITYPVKKMWPLGSSDEINLFLKEFQHYSQNIKK